MRTLLSVAAAAVMMVSAVAAPLSMPKDKPILEIAGSISATNKDGAAVFDREMLESLGLETITTTTPWHKGPVTFEGVRMSKVMQLVQAKGKTVKALALNDYETQIPMEDFSKFNVLLALKRDGTLWGWGSNAKGQLGAGTPNPSQTPVRVPGLGD